MKTSENLCFSDIFRGYSSGILDENELMIAHTSRFKVMPYDKNIYLQMFEIINWWVPVTRDF